MAIKFAKVSRKQFAEAMKKYYPEIDEEKVSEYYSNIRIPVRSTRLAAAYDFISPMTAEISYGEAIMIPTGIRVLMDEDCYLAVYGRSGVGCKYGVNLANGTGIIDADYSEADNEGHIFLKFTHNAQWGSKWTILPGDRIAQGVFGSYITVDGDNVTTKRTGGLGSTGA